MLFAAATLATLQPFHQPPTPAFFSELGVGSMAALAMLGLIAARQHKLLLTPLAVLPLVLVGALVLHAALGSYPYPSHPALMLAIPMLMLMAIVGGATLSSRLGAQQVLVWMATAWLIGGLLQVVLQLLQLGPLGLSLEPWVIALRLGDLRASGHLLQPNHLATLLSLSLVSATFLNAQGRLRSSVTVVAVMTLMVGVVLTASRTGAAQVVLIGLVQPWLDPQTTAQRRPRWLQSFLFLSAFAVAHLLAQGVGWILVSGTSSAMGRNGGLEMAKGLRFALMQNAWSMWSAHPWFGVGLGGFSGAQIAHLNGIVAVEVAAHAHNLVLQLLAETGIAGTLAIGAIFTLWTVRAVRDGDRRLVAYAGLLALVFLVHCLLEFPYAYAYFYVPLLFVAAAVEPAKARLEATGLTRWMVTALPLIALVLVPVLWREERAAAGLQRRLAEDAPTIESDAPDPSLSRVQTSLFYSWLSDRYELMATPVMPMNAEADLVSADKILRYQLWNFAIYRKTIYLALLGRDDEAIALLASARRLLQLDSNGIRRSVRREVDRHPELLGFKRKLDSATTGDDIDTSGSR